MSLKDYKYANFEILQMKDSMNCIKKWFNKLSLITMLNRSVSYNNMADSKGMYLYARYRGLE